MIWPVLILLFILVAGAVLVVTLAMKDSQGGDPLQDRLEEFAARGETVNLEEIELSQPLTTRIIFPMARKMGEIALRFTPQNAIQATNEKLELAGNPAGLDATLFWALRLAGISLGVFMVVLAGISPDGSFMKGKGLLFGIPAAVLGFYLPELWLRGRIDARQKEIRKAMPDALDLLTICVEAGLGLDSAMIKVAEKWDNALSLSFGRVVREISLGKIRKDALHDMADRMGVAEMTSFVAAVIQSEQLGVSLAKVLGIQADQMRLKRRQRAEEEAHKAPIKLLIPMAFLIFPSICIVLLTPAVLMLLRSTFSNLLGF